MACLEAHAKSMAVLSPLAPHPVLEVKQAGGCRPDFFKEVERVEHPVYPFLGPGGLPHSSPLQSTPGWANVLGSLQPVS